MSRMNIRIAPLALLVIVSGLLGLTSCPTAFGKPWDCAHGTEGPSRSGQG